MHRFSDYVHVAAHTTDAPQATIDLYLMKNGRPIANSESGYKGGEDVTDAYSVSNVVANGVEYIVFVQLSQSKKTDRVFVSNGGNVPPQKPNTPCHAKEECHRT